MASYKSFEDTPVWNAAIRMAADVFALTDRPAFKFRGDLVNQIRRASLSVSNNIAEGFERGTTSDFIHFLYIARGSAGETRSMLEFALLLDGMQTELEGIRAVEGQCLAVSRQLHGWIDSLKNTEIAGDRTRTDESKRIDEAKQREDEFVQALKERRLPELMERRKTEEAQAKERAEAEGIPSCPVCGAPMIKRHDKFGAPFWGCRKYPECRGSRSWSDRRRP